VCWPVSVDVVVAVDIGCAESPWVWLVEGPAAKTWVAAQAGKPSGW